MPKNSYFKIYKFKTVAWIKKFCKCDPSKSGVSKANEGFSGQKSFLGPPKHKKIIFSKNWNYMILLSIVRDSHSAKYEGPIGHFSGELL